MKKALIGTAILVGCGGVVMILLYKIFHIAFFEVMAIVLGTTFYHTAMRLLIGLFYQATLRNRVDYTKKWFRLFAAEQKLYQKLKVKRWKRHMPTYDATQFDITQHTYEELVMATCQAELVHETIVVFSFVPIFFTAFFGGFWVFFITSVLSAACDVLFVMMQRYNRPRLLKCMKRNLHTAQP